MHHALTLERALERDAHRYDFFQLLRLVDCAHPAQPRIGTSLSPRDDAIRLGQDAELIFHPGALAGFTRRTDGTPGRLAVNFLGLLGPNGPLPTHLTAYVRERARHANDLTLSRFLDVFHHRMLTLFYRAWASTQPVVNADRPTSDRFSAYVGTTFGLGAPATRGRDTIPDHAKLHFAGLLAAPTRHASGLRQILAQFFGVGVRIVPWRGHWLSLPDAARTRLGRATLGTSAVIGTQVWDVQHAFRIELGPLGHDDFVRFLPGGTSLPKLVDWVRTYVRDPLDWDVSLHLRQDDVRPLRLVSGDKTPAMRLGWTTWLTSGVPSHDNHRVAIAPTKQTGDLS